MGNCSNAPAKLKEEFHVAREYRDSALGELRILINDKLGREIALKEIKFGSRIQLEGYLKYAELALQYDNIPTLVRLNSYSIGSGTGESLSGDELNVIVNFDYYPNNFSDEIKRRRQQLQHSRQRYQNKAVSEKVKLFDYELIQTLGPSDRKHLDLFYLEAEILRLLDHVIGALYFLNHFEHEHLAVRPEHILIDQEGKYLLLDRKLLKLSGNYQQVRESFTGSSYRGCGYLSPREVAALRTRELSPQHSPQLSDVFAIGLIALEMATMEDLTTLYDYRNFRIDSSELKRLLDKASQRYSEPFVDLIRSMLEIDQNKRVNLNVLIDHLSPILTAGLEALNNAIGQHSHNASLSTANKPRNDFHDRLMQMELIYQHLLLTKSESVLEPIDEGELDEAQSRLLTAASTALQHSKSQCLFQSNSVYAMYMRQYENIRKSRQTTQRVLI